MTRGVASHGEAHGRSQARCRVGDYLFRDLDYRQVQQWASALDITPEKVVGHLAFSSLESDSLPQPKYITFVVEDGAIRSSTWALDYLPIIPKTWLDGLLIRELGFTEGWANPHSALNLYLPRLETLLCSYSCLSLLKWSNDPGHFDR